MQTKTIVNGIAWIATGPAIYVNIEATAMPWTPFAIGSVIFAAVFVSLAQARRSFGFGVLAAVFISINLATALGNVAGMSADIRDGRSSAIEKNNKDTKTRAKLDAAREVQVAIAGEDAAETIEGKLQAVIASDATRWKASDHCNLDRITKGATRTFCDKYYTERAKKAAAESRDKIDGELAELGKQAAPSAPSSPDPYAESLARFLSVFGFQFSDEGKALLSSSKDWGKAFGLELMAAFGPMALTLLFELLGSHPVPVPASDEGRAVAERKPAPAPVPSIDLPAVLVDDPAVDDLLEKTAGQCAHAERPFVACPPSPSPATKPQTAEDEPAAPMEPEQENVDQEAAPAADEPAERRYPMLGGARSWAEFYELNPDKRQPSGGKSPRKPKAGPAPRGDNVIQFQPKKKKPTKADVLALISAGRTQEQAAAASGIHVRTVKRYVAASKMSPSSRGQNEGTNQNG